MTVLAVASLVCAAVPLLLGLLNLRRLSPPPEPHQIIAPPRISVLIPARDEEDGIAGAVRSVLANEGVELDLVVLDDGSIDRTAEIVREIARFDPRLRLETAPPLPEGFCGKQHACWVLAGHARHPLRVFLDADVRLEADALRRIAAFMDATGADLASGFPRQITGTWLERLLIPMMHYLTLGFLPMGRMRRTKRPSFSAGCGQLMVVRAAAYEATGGHRAIARSLHDGLLLPRLFRRMGFVTELFDAVPVARCRMYSTGVQVWKGLSKNATEGLAAPATLLPMTVLLGLGQVAPPLLLVAGLLGFLSSPATAVAGVAVMVSYLPRLLSRRRFGHSWDSVLWHPLAVALLLTLQWVALVKSWIGVPSTWKGRSYGTA